MSAKSSQKPAPKHTPANFGITDVMRDRAIVKRIDCDGAFEICQLTPVPMGVFLRELTLMKKAGYEYITDLDEFLDPCPECGAKTRGLMSYHKRHRNGKMNLKDPRDFILCPGCMMVQEEFNRYYTPDEKGGDQSAESVTNPAA